MRPLRARAATRTSPPRGESRAHRPQGGGPRAEGGSSGFSAPGEAAAPPRPPSALYPSRPIAPCRCQRGAPHQVARGLSPELPGLDGVRLRQKCGQPRRYFTAPHLQPWVLTRLQGAQQPGRGPGNAAALLEHIAQDGAHAAALPLQASPPAPQRPGQLVLPHPRAPRALARLPSVSVPATPLAERLSSRSWVSVCS